MLYTLLIDERILILRRRIFFKPEIVSCIRTYECIRIYTTKFDNFFLYYNKFMLYFQLYISVLRFNTNNMIYK